MQTRTDDIPTNRFLSTSRTSHPSSPLHCNNGHEWVVFSTALKDVCLMVQCVQCGAMGTVDDPDEQEWSEAYYAPSQPYGWDDDSRVTVRGIGPLYVQKASDDHAEGEPSPQAEGRVA